MTYTQLAVAGVVAAVVLDTAVLRTRLVRRRAYWTAYGIVVFFQLVTNGILTGLSIVTYDPETVLGPRIVFAPVEDLLFGYAMVTMTLSWWVWWGRRAQRRAARARTSPGAATATRRSGPTDSRRSSTR